MIFGRFRLCITSCTVQMLLIIGISCALADERVSIQQGWTSEQKTTWYTTSQGSRLIPLSWLEALEQAESDQPFLADAHIEKFRYLPGSPTSKPRLPVGFAIDDSDDDNYSNTKLRWKNLQSRAEKWVGMNCAACHTAEITYRGKRMRIEGAPTLADFQGFIESLNKSLRATYNDPEKEKRFAARVLTTPPPRKSQDTPDNRRMLREALSKLIGWQQKIENANTTPLRYGYGRLDAFGHIFNKVALILNANGQTYHPSNAPVSYPFLWNVPQHDVVQWNGMVSNQRVGGDYDVGALGRNVGEVTGVFADVKLVPNVFFSPTVSSSADVENLASLEGQLKSLLPPRWPTGVLGKLDQKLRDRGRDIFRNTKRTYDGQVVKSCANCHRPLSRDNLDSPINARMIPLRESGTDIWMACNAVTHNTKTGALENYLYAYLPGIDIGSRLYEKEALIADLLKTIVVGTIFDNREEIVKGIFQTTRAPTKNGLGPDSEARSALPPNERPIRLLADQTRRNQCLNGTDPLLAYKARPLTGIWAGAPYLHNGSVPTLYDLLLPPGQRPKSFAVGTREYDPERVGFVTRNAEGNILAPSDDSSFLFNTRNALGRVIDGNSNAGHDYGNASLSEDDRMALVEYMKGL